MKKVILTIAALASLASSTQARPLTRDEMRVLWTDLAAGMASVELGPFSFLVGGAASMAASYSSSVSSTDGTGQSNPANPFDRTGLDHNKFCTSYAATGMKSIDVNLAKTIGIQVRPDMKAQIQAASNEEIQAKIDETKALDGSNPQSVLNFMKKYINTDEGTDAILLSKISAVNTSDDPVEAIRAFESSVVAGLNLNSEDRSQLLQGLAILRYSDYLWVK